MTVSISNITNKILNKGCLNNDVFKQLADSQLPFISSPSKICLKKYIDDDDLKASKKLWKSLLIDSICILKVNDSREKIYKDSEDNYEDLLNNFELIRKMNTYGINEIDSYFEDFIGFESVLYGTDKHYRDHVEHVLQVWAIGISLISNNNICLSDGYDVKNGIDFNFQIKEEFDREKTITKSELWSMWTIIALCHDLGYPIEKTSKINKQAKKIIAHFGNMNFSELNYSFDIFNTFLVDKYLNVISSKASLKNDSTTIQTKVRDKISKSLEDYKHGVFSGLLLFKNLTYFLETDYHLINSDFSKEDLRQFYIRKEILRSIAGHTCPKIYHLSLNTLSFLIILCDELKEWNRPNFDEFRNRTLGKEPDVELKEYDMSENQRVHIEFSYKNELSDEDKKHLVEDKFKNINNLLRSAKDDKDRKIYFEWGINFEDEIFRLIFDSSKNSFEQIKLTRKSTSKNSKEEVIDIY